METGNLRRRASGLLVPALLAIGAGSLGVGLASQQGPPPALATQPATETTPPTTPTTTPTATPKSAAVATPTPPPKPAVRGPILPASRPVRVEVPSIGVKSDLVTLGQNEDGSLQVPEQYSLAGWYDRSPTPGELGPSVIAGHVDSYKGPAVFYRLTQLKPGAEVLVRREDGTTATFRVDRVAQYPKDQFPTIEVYQNLDHAGLRLITCGGSYDERSKSYRDNIVAYASLVR